MTESFSAALYTNNKDTKTYPNCPLYPHRVELGPHFHKERGATIAGVLLNPGFKRRMGGDAALPGTGRVGFIPPGCRHQGSARCLRLPIVWGKRGNPQHKPVSSFWGPIWICPFLLLSFKEKQKCKDLKSSMNFISGST